MTTKTQATVVISGPEAQVQTFLRFCATVDKLCSWGASRTLVLAVDGDGAGALRFDFGGADVDVPADKIHSGKDPLHMGGIGDN